MNRRIAAFAVAVVGLTAGCSSTSSSGLTSAASTTTSTDPAATTTSSGVTTTTTTAVSTTVVVTVAPTAPPATNAPPVTAAPKPPASTAAPMPPGPTLSSVRLRDPFPSCNEGDVVTITIVFSTANAAGVTVWSSQDGDLGQYPAEFGGVEVQHTCIAGQTLYTLYPVASGGALGTPVDLYV